MSVTLMRYKDGKQIPLKLSVWDAFKGAPVPKLRPHKCNCCHKVHNAKKEELKDGAEHGKDDKKEDATKADIESPNEHGFSAEEDTVLKERKEGSPWQATMDELEKLGKTRTKSECQDRMKELKSAAVAQPDEKADSNANKDKKDDKQDLNQNKKGKQGKGKGEMTEEQKAKIEKKREEGRAKKAAEKVVDEKKEEIKDEVKAAVEAAKPADIPVKPLGDDKQRWIAAASKHFDRTGHRITPEQAKKMAEGSSS